MWSHSIRQFYKKLIKIVSYCYHVVDVITLKKSFSIKIASTVVVPNQDADDFCTQFWFIIENKKNTGSQIGHTKKNLM